MSKIEWKITRCGIRFIGGLAFLVQNNQPYIGKRRKHRAARPDDNARSTAFDPLERCKAIRLRESRVDHRRPLAEQ